jgi:hypothetical protein
MPTPGRETATAPSPTTTYTSYGIFSASRDDLKLLGSLASTDTCKPSAGSFLSSTLGGVNPGGRTSSGRRVGVSFRAMLSASHGGLSLESPGRAIRLES